MFICMRYIKKVNRSYFKLEFNTKFESYSNEELCGGGGKGEDENKGMYRRFII